MIDLNLLECPRCGGDLDAAWLCAGCGTSFDAPDDIPNLRISGGERTETVRRFYAEAPFPGYPPRDNISWLRMRAGRSEFARLLDQAIPGDARILEMGCGTGQMSLFLARAQRTVIAADLTRESLLLGAQAAKRFGLAGVHFIETDLLHPGLRDGAFDIVYSSGVLHHTANPRASFARIARLARPGGIVVIGLYNTLARLPLRLRRLVARCTGFRWIPFDPVLRDRRNEPERLNAWRRDQYLHPEEHRHTLTEVQGWFNENGIEYLRCYPSAVIGDEPDDLFAYSPDSWNFESWLAQLGWISKLGHEGGLFVTVGQRRETTAPQGGFK